MDDILGVQVVQTQAYMNEHLPDKVSGKWSSILLLYACAKITMLTILHDDVDTGRCDEGVKIPNHKMGVDFCQGRDLLHGLKSSLFW